ncbi:unnamed protein product [Calypogeia fissa]
MWVAFPPDFDVRTSEYRSLGSKDSGRWRGSIDFHLAFPRTPEVFTAFTYLNIEINFRVRLNVKATSKSRMDWSIEHSGETDIYDIVAQYFAVCL